MQNHTLRASGVRKPKAKTVKPVAHAGGKKKVKKSIKSMTLGGTRFVIAQRRQRTELVMSEAKKAGLVGGPKNTVIRGRVSDSLVKAAKQRAGVSSDTELLEVALSSLALEDDFGEQLLKLKGTIDPDLDLEF